MILFATPVINLHNCNHIFNSYYNFYYLQKGLIEATHEGSITSSANKVQSYLLHQTLDSEMKY